MGTRRQTHALPPEEEPAEKRGDTEQEKPKSAETQDGAGGEELETAKKRHDLTGKEQERTKRQETKRGRKEEGQEEPKPVTTRIIVPKEGPELNTKPAVVEEAEGEKGTIANTSNS